MPTNSLALLNFQRIIIRIISITDTLNTPRKKNKAADKPLSQDVVELCIFSLEVDGGITAYATLLQYMYWVQS